MNAILIWDWDGTLVDSIGYKYDAIWNEVFPNDLERQRIVKAFIRTPQGKGVNRYGLIQHVLAKTGTPETAMAVQAYADRYHVAATEHAAQVGLFPGIAEMLQRLYQKGRRMYIVSGGGTDADLAAMADHLGVGRYFCGILGFGAPGTSLASFGKHENFQRIVSLEKQDDSRRYIVIGDGATDKTFAEEIGSGFIGIANEWNLWQADGKRVVAETIDVESLLD